MAAARAAVGVAVLDGKLYALGGENEDEADQEDEGVISRTVERYDPATNAWEEVTARHSPCVAVEWSYIAVERGQVPGHSRFSSYK